MLLEAFTVLQNVAVPFTLDLELIAADVESRVVNLAREVGLPDAAWNSAVASLDAASQVRVRLARALALDPDVVLLEHPTVDVDRQQVGPLGEHIQTVARRRGAAVVALTGDIAFANAVGTRVLTLDASTGRLIDRAGSSRGYYLASGKPWRWHCAEADSSAVAEIRIADQDAYRPAEGQEAPRPIQPFAKENRT